MKQIEANIIESFRLAKNDIMRLERDVADLSKNQERMMEIIHSIDTKDSDVKSALNDIRERNVRLQREFEEARVATAAASMVKERDIRDIVRESDRELELEKARERALDKELELQKEREKIRERELVLMRDRELTVQKELEETRATSRRTASMISRKRTVASRTGKKFHNEDCAFARRIMAGSRVTFMSPEEAFNAGYRACECIKS
jgi:hypothetical protein